MEVDLLFDDWQRFIKGNLAREPWITVYCCNDNGNEQIGIYCALIPDDAVDEVLSDHCWDLSTKDGFPVYNHATQEYVRFSVSREGVEPLIFCREFPGLSKIKKRL